MIKVLVERRYIEKMGTGSLVALVGQSGAKEGDEVCLQFEQTSLKWRELHGGNDTTIIPEYVPCCIAEDMAKLCRIFNITVEVYHNPQYPI